MKLSFTQFIDFTTKGPDAKITFIKKLKNSDDYHPGKDYWKTLRDKIIFICSNDSEISQLDLLLSEIDERKIKNYSKVVNNFKKFAKGKDFKWFKPPKAAYSYDETTINVNHELGLFINGEPYIIKLVFGENISQHLDKRKSVIPSTLSYYATEFHELPENCKVMFLDLKKNKTYVTDRPTNAQRSLLESELIAFNHLYKNN